MTITALNTNSLSGVRHDNAITLPITDSTTITKDEFVELSSGKLITSITTLSSSLVGIAQTTKTQGLNATTGRTEEIGIVTEGIVKVKGLVEGSGGTYTTALAVGDTVSFHYDSTASYGQFVVNSSASPIGKIVGGSVASSGTTADQWDYVLVQLNFESGSSGSGLVDSSVTTAKIADSNITSDKVDESIVCNTKGTKHWLDVNSYAMTATQTSTTVTWSSATLSTTAGVRVFCQALTATGTIPIPSAMTATSFTITGTASQTGNWFAWIPDTSL